GRLEYSGALVDNGTRSQTAFVAPHDGNWVKASLENGDNGINAHSEAFDQFTTYADNASGPPSFATVTLIASAVGIVNVSWNTNTGSGFELKFFGLTNAPGPSFTIGVPEPSTAVLLLLGSVVLAARRRASA